MWPEGRIAARSLMDTPITLDSASRILTSSPTVLTSRRRGEDPGAFGTPPTTLVCGSETLVTVWPESRSYHSLPMMPLTEGVAPLRKVEWPTAVRVAA